jgi:hypothetical protein
LRGSQFFRCEQDHSTHLGKGSPGFGYHQVWRESYLRKGSPKVRRGEPRTWEQERTGRKEIKAEAGRAGAGRKKKKIESKEAETEAHTREKPLRRDPWRHGDSKTQFLNPKGIHFYPMQHGSHGAEAAGTRCKTALR